MDIDLLPFNAFALDSVAAAPAIEAETCTLTLRAPVVDAAGQLAVLPALAGDPLHASVVSGDSMALTITF